MTLNTSLRVASLLAALGGMGGSVDVGQPRERVPSPDPLRLLPFRGGSRGNSTRVNHRPGHNLPDLEDRPRNLHRGHTLRRARGPLSYAQHDRLVARWGAREARAIERHAYGLGPIRAGEFIERVINVPAGEKWS